MSETVIVTIISFTGTLLGTLGGIVASAKLTLYRIEQLEKKVEKHNNLIERVYKIEERTTVAEEKIQTVEHRVDGLETR
jgi:uncharacterized protein Yka (UPF0111/DUF47 family)